MWNQTTKWIPLIALCLLVLGCGGESATQDIAESSDPSKAEGSKPLAMVLEVSEPTIWRNNEHYSATDWVGQVATMPSKMDRGYLITIDESFEREGQLRVLFDPTWGDEKNAVDLEAEANAHFARWKEGFERTAKEGLEEELAYHEMAAETAGKEIKQLQQTLQTFQEARRGLPQTDASRLERRKLERQIETTLQAQIEANKRVESLQKRIDRERYITLVRVR